MEEMSFMENLWLRMTGYLRLSAPDMPGGTTGESGRPARDNDFIRA
jgi:hypothetical protein